MTIAEFLEARIAEDEYAIQPFQNELGETREWRADDIGGRLRQVGPLPFGLPDLLATFGTHLESFYVARWDPARTLAECAAKRAIIALHETVPTAPGRSDTTCAGCGDAFNERPCPTLAHLAAVYATHPDYRQEWSL